jgi:hypothetical protein
MIPIPVCFLYRVLAGRNSPFVPLSAGVTLHSTAAIRRRYLILRGTLKASEMPMMVLVSQPGGRFNDCKR